MQQDTDRKVNVYQMVAARDRRVARQEKMLEEYRCPVVSFTLNIPGPVKTSDHFLWAFEKGKQDILAVMKSEGWGMKMLQSEYEITGYEFMISVESDPTILKKKLTEIEEDTALGRLYDIDVIGLDGRKIGREEIGKGMRKCIICQEDAHVCARNRSHSIEEMLARINEIILEAEKEYKP